MVTLGVDKHADRNGAEDCSEILCHLEGRKYLAAGAFVSDDSWMGGLLRRVELTAADASNHRHQQYEPQIIHPAKNTRERCIND